MYRILFLLFLIIPSALLSAQDTIYMKDGRTVSCTVTRIDSSKVYFDFERKNKIISTTIKRDDFNEIILNNPSTEPTNFDAWLPSNVLITMGLAIPRGDFASDDILVEKAGFALKGFNISGTYQYNFTPRIAGGVKVYYNANRLKTEYLADLLHTRLSLPVKINTVIYSSYGILAGPAVNSLYKHLNIQAYYYMGRAYFVQPTLTYTIVQGSYVSWIRFEEVTSKSFVQNFGVVLKYTINNNVDLVSNIDYIRSSFDYDETGASTLYGQFGIVSAGTLLYKVVNVSVGLGFKF